MSKFEDDLLNSVKCSITQQIKKTDFIQIPYNQRVKLDNNFMEKAWGLVDQDNLIKNTIREIRGRTC
jgi:hypothetical protein